MPQVIFFGMFFKKVEKIYVELHYLKERFNIMEIEIDSENKIQPNWIRKQPLLLSQEESLVKKVKKYPCLFDKSQNMSKERGISQKYSLSKTFVLFSCFDYFFFEFLKTKITSYQTLWCPSWFQLSKFFVQLSLQRLSDVNISRF